MLCRKGFQLLAIILRRVALSLQSLSVVLFCIFYVFVDIGVFCYGGLIERSPDSPHYWSLLRTKYGQGADWTLNFNDMPRRVQLRFMKDKHMIVELI